MRWVGAAVAVFMIAAAAAGTGEVRTDARTSSEKVSVIVRLTGPSAVAQAAVGRLGGTVTTSLGIVNGFSAVLPADRIDDLGRAHGILSVTPDASLQLLGAHWKPDKDLGSYSMTTTAVNAQDLWRQSDSQGARITGKGVGVALIDSGVSPVEGLLTPGKVVNAPDLSFESQAPTLRYLDTFGHGTHLAGIIAGRDATVKPGDESGSKDFEGLAPDATLVNLKVAASDGAVDVSQVIASIDWAVQHRDDRGLNIRVINLSFGTDSIQSYQLDPLAYAVEVAWRRGIVVVVAAGNDGAAGTTLAMPAIDPYVISVGASDHNGTHVGSDDSVATFSSVGNSTRRPDLLAPGRSIVSLRDPGSAIDQENPTAVVADKSGPRFFRGSGTSQAAAVVSGAAALLLQQRPALTPDQVKYVLIKNARTLPAQGAGVLELKDIAKVVPPADYRQTFPLATGTGSLEQSRGGSHVADPQTGIELSGEQDIMGAVWDGPSWATAALEGTSWQGGIWLGESWTGVSWFGRTGPWPAVLWDDSTWAGRSWSGINWSDNSWSGRSWSGRSWSGRSWSGRSWSGRSWS